MQCLKRTDAKEDHCSLRSGADKLSILFRSPVIIVVGFRVNYAHFRTRIFFIPISPAQIHSPAPDSQCFLRDFFRRCRRAGRQSGACAGDGDSPGIPPSFCHVFFPYMAGELTCSSSTRRIWQTPRALPAPMPVSGACSGAPGEKLGVITRASRGRISAHGDGPLADMCPTCGVRLESPPSSQISSSCYVAALAPFLCLFLSFFFSILLSFFRIRGLSIPITLVLPIPLAYRHQGPRLAIVPI